MEVNPNRLQPSAAKQLDGTRPIGETLNKLSGADARDKPLKEGSGSTNMGKDEFLKLFMEQLKQQDPLQPMKNNEFSQHMALFSQLEQQINMNENLEKVIAGQNKGDLEAMQLIGKDVEGAKASFQHEKGGVSPIRFDLPSGARDVHIDIVSDKGEIVRTLALGEKKAGAIDMKWDGSSEGGKTADAGQYFTKVRATDMNGQPIKVGTDIKGKVNGITREGGRVFLLVGENKVALSDVSTIREPAVKEEAQKNGENANKAVGTNSEAKSKDSQDSAASKVNVSLDDDVKQELQKSAGLDKDGRDLNGVMPFWYR